MLSIHLGAGFKLKVRWQSEANSSRAIPKQMFISA